MYRLICAVFFMCGSSNLCAVEGFEKPRLSIITSVWRGDAFIESFLLDITQQTIFPECELIIINANSPGNEEGVILSYAAAYPNIRYVRLKKDPGLYGVWNRGIQLANADIVTNANIDDRSSFNSFEIHLKEIEADPSVDLVYSGFYITHVPNETFAENGKNEPVNPPEFSPKIMKGCHMGPRPMWRRSMHDKYGYFDAGFISAGDWEMWARAVSLGSKFKKIPGVYTLYYLNPQGLSTTKDKKVVKLRRWEEKTIQKRYGHLWK